MDREDVLNLKDPPNGFGDQLVNAAISGGLAFFTTLAAVTVAGIKSDPTTAAVAACIAAGLNFFTSLAIQRGLRKEE